MFLVAVDDFSKWSEIVEMTLTTAAQTVKVLQDIFTRYDLPEQLVSDSGSRFVSADFADFCKGNTIRHVWVVPYHPASNSFAESMVQTFRQAMRRTMNDGLPLQCCIADFLPTYIEHHTQQPTVYTTDGTFIMNTTGHVKTKPREDSMCSTGKAETTS